MAALSRRNYYPMRPLPPLTRLAGAVSRHLPRWLGGGAPSPFAGGSRAAGERGERAAEEHLRRQGYRIVERNWRGRHGEVDLIARDGDALVFVEVKSGQAEAAIAPQVHVTVAKRRQLLHLAEAYRKAHRLLWQSARIDVIEVLWGDDGRVADVRHHQAAVSDERRGRH
jgi:putative endonuclease